MTKASRSKAIENAAPDGRASDAIVEQIQEQILSGALLHNTPLPSERDLMERFSASRTVVREAVATLAGRGLLEAKPRFRPIIRKPGFDTALNTVGSIVELMLQHQQGAESLFQSRVFVERGLVRDAATSATRENIAELKVALAANEAAIMDSDAFYDTDMDFHGVLYTIPGNPIFPTLHSAYTTWLAPHWRRMKGSPEFNRKSYASHLAIYTAILERDPDAAEKALVTHLNVSWSSVGPTFAPK